jgi:large subunit ribosomal protein L14
MIQLRTVLKPADNSGAKLLNVIHVYGGSGRKIARLGDVVLASVNQSEENAVVKDSQLVKAVIVRTRKEFRRADGSYIRFDENAAVVIDSLEAKNPLGTRIFGPIAREVKERGYAKIASLAKEVL